MKVYTSYFGNAKKLKENNIKMVSVALCKPKFFNGVCMTHLAPNKYMVFGDITNEEYVSRYKNILNNLNPEVIANQLKEIGNGSDIALCCYEKYGDFCHRHLLSDWLNENTDFDVIEFGIKEQKETKNIQISLF